MYKINLYPAGLERRVNRAASIRSTMLLALLGGANLLVLGFFFLIATSVSRQAQSVEERALVLQSRMTQNIAAAKPALGNQARLLLERRAARVVWTPALDELRSIIPADLILERLEATQSGAMDVFSGMQISGRLKAGQNIDQVVTFINRMSTSPAYKTQFAPGKLERVDNSQDVSRFVIACPLLKPTDDDSDTEGSGG